MPIITQLIVTILLIVLATMIHGTGVALIGKALRYEKRDFTAWKLLDRELRVMVPLALGLIGLHVVEISVFATFYRFAGEIHALQDAIYHSALAYSTMGVVEGEVIEWPLVVAFEGLTGFVMIGWSSAIFVTHMDRLLHHGR